MSNDFKIMAVDVTGPDQTPVELGEFILREIARSFNVPARLNNDYISPCRSLIVRPNSNKESDSCQPS